MKDIFCYKCRRLTMRVENGSKIRKDTKTICDDCFAELMVSEMVNTKAKTKSVFDEYKSDDTVELFKNLFGMK